MSTVSRVLPWRRSSAPASVELAPLLATFRDLGSIQLLLSLQDERGVELYCDSLLGRLVEHDSAHGSSLVDSLRAKFAGDRLRSRRLELADLDDEMEVLYERGVTDGLPVTPPTEGRPRAGIGRMDRADGGIRRVPLFVGQVHDQMRLAVGGDLDGCRQQPVTALRRPGGDRKSTRLNSSHT